MEPAIATVDDSIVPTGALQVSQHSQDAEAAKRICEA